MTLRPYAYAVPVAAGDTPRIGRDPHTACPPRLAQENRSRAVERGTGRRFLARDRAVTIPLRVPPGDGALFELY
jgi:hypothetical protein